MRPLRGFRKLGSQLLLYVMLISLAVLAGFSYFIYSFMQNMVREQNESLLLQQFQQLDHNIDGLVSEVDRLSMLFLRDDRIQNLLYGIADKTEVEFLESKNDVQNVIADFIDNYGYIDSIYITSDNLGAVGGSEDRTLVYDKEEWKKSFFTSEPFQRTIQRYPELVLEPRIRKSFYNPYMTGDADGYLVSLMRGTRAIYDPNTSATLIFNIDERYLASLYAASLKPDEGDMYIVDGSGMVLSSSRPEQVGTRAPFVPASSDPGGYGSFDERSGGRDVQIVYYRMDATDWYLTKEIPLARYSEQIFAVQRLVAIVFLLSVLAIFVASYFWLRRMIRPLRLLAEKMQDMSRGELGVTMRHIPNNELGTLIRRFNEMSLSMVELVDKNNEIQEKKRELELEALQYQINPHFLYNTLNMIRWMAAIVKADNIVGTIVALGNLLRPVFSKKDPMCALRDELEYLQNYLTIAGMRFGDDIRFEQDVPEELKDCRVPRFILQPLVENSIAAGRQEETPGIMIEIGAFEEDGVLTLSVTDSGAGLTPEEVEGLNAGLERGDAQRPGESVSGVGLNNVNKRIRLYFGDDYGVRFVPREKGAEAVVTLPALQSEDEFGGNARAEA